MYIKPHFTNQSLAPLSLLSSNFNVPASYFFCYFQFSHAFCSHFHHSTPQVIQSALEDVLKSECVEKPTFRLYSNLVMVSLPVLEGLRARGQSDIPDLEGNAWDYIWDFPFRSLVSLRNCLMQFRLVDHEYVTPIGYIKLIPALPPSAGGVGGSPEILPIFFAPAQSLSSFGRGYCFSYIWLVPFTCNLPCLFVFWVWLNI